MVNFVSVHGSCRGGWCWKKVIPLLSKHPSETFLQRLIKSYTYTKKKKHESVTHVGKQIVTYLCKSSIASLMSLNTMNVLKL